MSSGSRYLLARPDDDAGLGPSLPLGTLRGAISQDQPRQDWPRELDGKIWWHGHRSLQYTGGVAMALALVSSSYAPKVPKTAARIGAVGSTVAALAAAQFLSAWLRGPRGARRRRRRMVRGRGTTTTMTPRRILFERFHKTTGYLLILLATVATYRVSGSRTRRPGCGSRWPRGGVCLSSPSPGCRAGVRDRYLSGDLGTGIAASRQWHEAHRVGHPSA